MEALRAVVADTEEEAEAEDVVSVSNTDDVVKSAPIADGVKAQTKICQSIFALMNDAEKDEA